MIDSAEFLLAIDQLVKEKGMNVDELYSTIKQALKTALKKTYNVNDDAILVDISKETGKITAFYQKTICEVVQNPNLQISLEEAQKIRPTFEIGDVVQTELDLSDFKRIAAQAAKNYIRQQLRESEKNMMYNEFKDKKDEIMSAVVQKIEKKNLVLELGEYEAIMPVTEQVQGEQYNFNDRINVYISEVKIANKSLQIIVSRTHPGLVRRLFEKEVPEISTGLVEIKGVFREAGSRTKIAVASKEENIDPVGACVGHKGERVQNIVNDLRGEKIDIIKWSEDPVEFISASLSPSKVLSVKIVDEENKKAQVIVPDYQLSLAIGKDGQNARLAARLTGWKIDIKSYTEGVESGSVIPENIESEATLSEAGREVLDIETMNSLIDDIID